MFQMLKKFTGFYGVENRKRRLRKAKELKNDNNCRYHQFDGGYEQVQKEVQEGRFKI